MRVREHFLLGTEKATISVTARDMSNRRELFAHALESILARYGEEFGQQEQDDLLASLTHKKTTATNWRLHPEDSCWNQS